MLRHSLSHTRKFVFAFVFALTLFLAGTSAFCDEAARALDNETWDHLLALGAVSDATDGSLQRTFLSFASRLAMDKVESWMREGGMDTWVDEVGNVHGRLEGATPNQKVLLVGSHIDTVKDAGKFDGTLGVLVGISSVKALILNIIVFGQQIPGPVQVVAFSDEEGVRFSSTFLGSRAMVGLLSESADNATDENGISMLQALRHGGFKGSRQSILTANISDTISSYVEVHIEQGPVLHTRGESVAPVAAISGQTRLTVSVHGTQGHAGTVPMSTRKDAVAGAAEIIHFIETFCKTQAQVSDGGTMLVCTVGEIRIWPGSSNVISSNTNFTIDIRSRSNHEREGVVLRVTEAVNRACLKRDMICRVDLKHEAPAANCDIELTKALNEAIIGAQRHDNAGDEYLQSNVSTLISGAGHDSLALHSTCPIGMLFVRCVDGISHSPEEYTTAEDVAFAGRVLFEFLRARNQRLELSPIL
jgi:allantoate deiminase